MSHTSKIFEEAPVKVQNKNGFDLSHLNCGTSKCGQLVPVMCKLLPPNSDFTLGVNLNVELPPLATSFMGRIDAIVEGFVVPCSILYGGWKQFIMNQQATAYPSSQTALQSYGNSANGDPGNTGYELPYVNIGKCLSLPGQTEIAQCSTLYNTNDNVLEYLGFRPIINTVSYPNLNISLLPMLAYHLIWDVWYRNKQVTRTIFAVNPNFSHDSSLSTSFNTRNVSLIWHSFYHSRAYSSGYAYPFSPDFTLTGNHPGLNIPNTESTPTAALTFPDGTSIFSTRQRNYARDYFTAGNPTPQQGNPSKLTFSTSGSTGEFTINALRAANSLQKFLETNNLSSDFADMMLNRWGCKPIDADFDEPYYLGRVVLPVYQKSVYQTTNTEGTAAAANPAVNPFARDGQLGAKGAHGGFAGEGSITEKFHNSTWSYVMCIFSLVPHAAYGYGINRELCMLKIGDFPAPEMQSIGNEAVNIEEVYYSNGVTPGTTFSYVPRYSRFKYMDDEIHSELRPGKSLDSFVLQRVFASAPTFGTAFLEISQDALDDVFAVSTASMHLSCWYEIYFAFKVSMPLADYCIPTLGDIQDTHTQKTKIGGSRL